MANTSRYTRKPPLDVPLGIESIHWHRGLPTIVRGNLSQANRFARATVGERRRYGACTARLGGFISTTSPGKIIIERDDYQSLFGAPIERGWQVKKPNDSIFLGRVTGDGSFGRDAGIDDTGGCSGRGARGPYPHTDRISRDGEFSTGVCHRFDELFQA
jgi:hypothetical protein